MEKLNLLNFQKIEFTKLNDQFMLAKCFVLAVGKNRNKSHFSKENINKAYPSLNFIPVVGHVMCDDNGNYYLGGHDVKLDLTNGFKLKSLCVPYGVAIPSQDPVYEEVEEDGNIKEYLTTNVVLWTGRYPELEKTFYNENILCGQSMEILYSQAKPLEEDEEYLDIADFTFDALCMLGKSDDSKFNVEPCFPNAKIESSFSIDKELFEDFKQDLIKEFGSLKELNFHKKGGKGMDEKIELLAQYNLSAEELDFSIDELSLEELQEKLKDFTKEDVVENIVEDAVLEENNQENEQEFHLEESKFSTYNGKRDALQNLFPSEVERDSKGSIVKEVYYYLMDFDDNFAYVSVDTWTPESYVSEHYRYPYTFNSDDNTASLNGEREKLYRMWLTEEEKKLIEDSKKEFEAYAETHSHSNEEYDELLQYKSNKEKEEFDLAISNICADFEDISDKNEFTELLKNKDNHTLESFGKECIFIRGLYASTNIKKKKNFSKESAVLKINLNDSKENDVAVGKYDYLKTKYLNK